MTTPITKEWLQQTIEDIEDVLKTNISGKNDSDVVNMLTALKMALAAMDAEPVADVVAWHKEGEERTCDIRWRRFDVAPGPLFAVAQPVPVDNTFIPKNLDRALGVVGVALPESKEEFNFQIERWIQRLIDRVIRYADEFKEQPAPVVPDERCQHLSDLYHAQEKRLFKLAQRIKGPSFDKYAYSPSQAIDVLESAIFGDTSDARAAMLNHSEHERDMVQPVSQPYKLPEEKGASLQLRNLIRKRHAEWSDATFGNVGPIGPLKHLSKEALEAAAEPDDLSEWADMQFLLWDAQRRAGISDREITAAMEEKLKVNMARQWPEPKDGEPRMHINEPGNSPVIPDGWQLVPKRLTAENGAKGALSGEFSETKFINCPECFGDEDCETCDGSGRIEISVPVSWTTIKAIWAKGVEHFSEAPQQEGM